MSAPLTGREAEWERLSAFVETGLSGKRGAARTLYISGPPGNGKTATTSRLLSSLSSSGRLHYHHLNCMSISPPSALFQRLLDLLSPSDENATPSRRLRRAASISPEQTLVSIVGGLDTPTVVVLDEVDQLMTESPEVLYTAFSLPNKAKRFLLIGIANSLDLTERFLPKLKLALGSAPELIHFAPYTKDQLKAILSASTATDLGDANATELCARKISAADGDVRKAIDIARSAKKAKGGSAVSAVLAELKAATASPVHRARLTAQQKLLLAAALSLHSHGSLAFTFGQLNAAFREASGRLKLEASDPKSLLDLLVTQGLLGRSAKRQGKKTPMKEPLLRLMVPEEEARAVLNDDALVSRVLEAAPPPSPLTAHNKTRRALF